MTQFEPLQTKITKPQLARKFTDRPRLTNLISRDPAKLTVVTAPAGYGKSSLLVQWTRKLEQSGARVAWLSLDPADADIASFLFYVVHAVRAALAEFGRTALQLLEAKARPDALKVAFEIARDLVATESEVTLFMDDFHHSDSVDVAEVVSSLMSLAPASFRLIVASRSIVHLPIARFAAKNGLRLVDAAMLRFDLEETDCFLRRREGHALTTSQLETLHRKTEGWIAALKFASLSLSRTDDVDTFIQSFAGDQRDVANYLASDVLATLPASTRDFLLKTSILDRMSASLCSAVTQRGDCQEILEELESGSLFLTPLDQYRRWYRYHRLFQDYLRRRLLAAHDIDSRELCRAASLWCVGHGAPDEAVEYALAAQDYTTAADLVELHASRMMQLGLIPRLMSWIDKIPAAISNERARIWMFRGWALFHMNAPDAARNALAHAERMVADWSRAPQPPSDASMRQITQELSVLRAGVATASDDVEHTLCLSCVPVDRDIENYEWVAGVMKNIHGYALYASSRFDQARTTLEEALSLHECRGELRNFGYAYSKIFLGMVALAEGRLHSAGSLFQHAEEGASAGLAVRTPGVAASRLLRGIVLYYWGRIDAADRLLAENCQLVEECGHPEILVLGYIYYARLQWLAGKPAAAASLLDYIIHKCREVPLSRLLTLAEHERFRQAVAIGEIDVAQSIAAQMAADCPPAPGVLPSQWDRERCVRLLATARLMLAQTNYTAAIEIAAHLRRLSAAVGRELRNLEATNLQAIACWRGGQQEHAVTLLCESVIRACEHDNVGSFLDEEGLLPILKACRRRVAASGTASENSARTQHLERIVAAISKCAGGRTHAASGPERHHDQVECITEKELSLLKVLAQGCSNLEIARKLDISENTVKWHLKNIYLKLGARNRVDAVNIAARYQMVKENLP